MGKLNLWAPLQHLDITFSWETVKFVSNNHVNSTILLYASKHTEPLKSFVRQLFYINKRQFNSQSTMKPLLFTSYI